MTTAAPEPAALALIGIGLAGRHPTRIGSSPDGGLSWPLSQSIGYEQSSTAFAWRTASVAWAN